MRTWPTILSISLCILHAKPLHHIINDITTLNPIEIDSMVVPTTTAQIIQAIVQSKSPISIGGGRFSMGGQIGANHSIHIDMRQFNRILQFDASKKTITVQAGVTWDKIQHFIDPYNLSVKIMQTYANFTVGGSLSVNVHGRYVGSGPIINSVQSFKIILASGKEVRASPKENPDIFYSAIGGYGGLGVITEATLKLTENCKIRRWDTLVSIKDYQAFFVKRIQNNPNIIFHNGDLYPNAYHQVRAVSYEKTSAPLTIADRIHPHTHNYLFNQWAFKIVSDFFGGKWIREHIIDPIIYLKHPVEWRNYEASYDTYELEPKSRQNSTYVLQEYFIPVQYFDRFVPQMASILNRHHVNVINVSIRHSPRDTLTTLSWAQNEVFAFVIYYKQGVSKKDQLSVANWTHELIDAALSCKGSYYLPYQVIASPSQFLKAYPKAEPFFKLKSKLDPEYKFRNALWDKYYHPYIDALHKTKSPKF